MTKLIAALVLLALTSVAAASPVVGELVTYRTATSQYNLAVIGRVVSGSTVDLVAFSDGTTWQDQSTPPGVATITYYSVALGSSVGQYQATTIIEDTIDAAGFATEAWVSSNGYATTSYVNGLAPNYLALPPAPSSASLTLGGSGVQLHASRPVLVTVRGTASMTSTLAGGQAYTVDLRCDSGSTPTAVVDDAAGSLTQTLGLSVSLTEVQPWKLVTLARAGDYCRVVQSAGAATLALTGSSAQAL